MSESRIHRDYVKMLVDYATTILPEENKDRLYADIDGYQRPTLAYDSFVPDVMYAYKGTMFIGEAKTYDDFGRDHSLRQYNAYFKEGKNYPGKVIIAIAIPWNLFITAQNHFLRLKKKYDERIKVIVISENGVKAEL